MSVPVLYPNLAAEEGPGKRPPPKLVEKWRERWEALWEIPSARLPWLPREGLVPWLSTQKAQAEAQARGLAYAAPDPRVVARVHDKAFALSVHARSEYRAPSLDELLTVFEPSELRGPEANAHIVRAFASWPAWAQAEGFALKPRRATSGRGRVGGRDPEAITPRALARLAARGGAVLEPWLARTRDLSVQVHVPPDGEVELLCTLEQSVTPSGVYAGNRGVFEEGRVRALDLEAAGEARLISAAFEVARAAQAEGFFGPCGVDAFFFRGPGVELRPVVELNARTTTGTLAFAAALAHAEAGAGSFEWSFSLEDGLSLSKASGA